MNTKTTLGVIAALIFATGSILGCAYCTAVLATAAGVLAAQRMSNMEYIA